MCDLTLLKKPRMVLMLSVLHHALFKAPVDMVDDNGELLGLVNNSKTPTS